MRLMKRWWPMMRWSSTSTFNSRPACTICSVTATSSGGTYAGTLLGRLLHHLDYWRLWAVPVSEDVAHHTAKTETLCRAAIEQFATRWCAAFERSTLGDTPDKCSVETLRQVGTLAADVLYNFSF